MEQPDEKERIIHEVEVSKVLHEMGLLPTKPWRECFTEEELADIDSEEE